jgi:DNA-binding Lrp family transcriptional regulator
VREIYSLIGEFDLMLHVKVNSFRDFHYLLNKQLKTIDEILALEVQFVDKIEALNK